MRKSLIPFACILCSLPLAGQVSVFTSTNSVSINGAIGAGEWADASSPISIDQLVSGSSGGASDISGTVRLKWDATNLYALFQITDDLRGEDSADGTPSNFDSYNDDSVELYFSNSWPGTGDLNDYPSNHQLRMNPGTSQELETYWLNAYSGTNWGASSPGPNANYIVEVQVPWSELGVTTPTIGNSFAFMAGINDDDDGTDRDAQLFWNTLDPNAYNDATQWSEIQLAAAIPEPSTYAMIFGAVGLGAWFFIKRRQISEAAK
ncbi:MAG: PEP-CTERM sorting domain-containing protein [Verrucomicrobiae bacterium]|nr:PEP-CTERM sorting domain-containing protein [Verrucomicrobiae bacterium]